MLNVKQRMLKTTFGTMENSGDIINKFTYQRPTAENRNMKKIFNIRVKYVRDDEQVPPNIVIIPSICDA